MLQGVRPWRPGTNDAASWDDILKCQADIIQLDVRDSALNIIVRWEQSSSNCVALAQRVRA